MVKDYHMHPMITQIPKRFDEFAQRAIELGIKEVCVTDHMPLSVSNAADRIPAGKVKEYCRNVREAASKYEGRLSVKLGIEVDYHPKFIEEIANVLGEGEFDYILGSTHMHVFLQDKLDGKLAQDEFASLALENTLSAVRSGYFTVLPHIDQYRWVFARPERFKFSKCDYSLSNHLGIITEILDEVAKRDMYLEINPHLIKQAQQIDDVYPPASIVEMAMARGIRFKYGSDAHQPQSVGAFIGALFQHPVYGKAMKQIEQAGD